MHLSQPLLMVFAGTFVPYLDGWLIFFVPNVLRSHSVFSCQSSRSRKQKEALTEPPS